MRFMAPIEEAIESDGPRKWRALRELYAYKDQAIRDAWPHMVNPYPVDWKFTPIEYSAWQTIRILGLPFYPQYPIGRYFVDFADPVMRLALECDGKDWHDPVKDARRDAAISALGWRVKRFTGRQCYWSEDNPNSMDAWLHSLAETQYRRVPVLDEDE